MKLIPLPLTLRGMHIASTCNKVSQEDSKAMLFIDLNWLRPTSGKSFSDLSAGKHSTIGALRLNVPFVSFSGLLICEKILKFCVH